MELKAFSQIDFISTNHTSCAYDFNDFTRKFDESNLEVACGSFGAVRQYDHPCLREVAIKHIEISSGNISERNRDLQKIKNEAAVATRLRHKNIVRCYGTTRISDKCSGIVMEYVEGGTLQDLIQQGKNDLPWFKRQSMLFELATALDYMHNYKEGKQIVHGDVKPQNILLTAEFSVKLADFGSANFVKDLYASVDTLDDAKSKQMTLFYAAPELLRETNQRCPSVDIYSFAMVAYEVLTMQEVYSDADRPQPVIIAAVLCGERPSSKPLDDVQEQLTGDDIQIFNVLREMTEKCWTDDPRLRPTAKQVCDLIEPKKTAIILSFIVNPCVVCLAELKKLCVAFLAKLFLRFTAVLVFLLWIACVMVNPSTAPSSPFASLLTAAALIFLLMKKHKVFDDGVVIFRRNGPVFETAKACILAAFYSFCVTCILTNNLNVANWKWKTNWLFCLFFVFLYLIKEVIS